MKILLGLAIVFGIGFGAEGYSSEVRALGCFALVHQAVNRLDLTSVLALPNPEVRFRKVQAKLFVLCEERAPDSIIRFILTKVRSGGNEHVRFPPLDRFQVDESITGDVQFTPEEHQFLVRMKGLEEEFKKIRPIVSPDSDL